MGLRLFPAQLRAVLFFFVLFGVSAGVSLAPQTKPEPELRERGPLADKFVREKLPLWQSRLKLEDWKISILSVHPSGLRAQTMGNIHWDADKKSAVIRVLDASDYHMPFHATLNDMEFTIVHELIHLELVSLPRSEASRSDEEHAINHLADALLQFDRRDDTLGALKASSSAASHER
jgi:hypothetical protein